MRRLIYIATLLILSFLGQAQDIHFSQFMAAPQQVNPALTGMFNGDLRVMANYRRQWGSVTIPYRTMAVSGDTKLTKGIFGDDFIGVGLFIYSDTAGDIDFTTNQINLSLAYHKSLSAESNHYLSVGVVGGFAQRSVNPSKMTFDNQFNGIGFDPNIGIADNIPLGTYVFGDLGAGISWYYGAGEHSKAYAGASMYHINQPNQSFYTGVDVPLKRKQVFYAGGAFVIYDRFSIQPQAIYLNQWPHTELLLGGYLHMDLTHITDVTAKDISVGFFNRFGDAMIAVVRLGLDDWQVGMSYDINSSRLTAASLGRGGPEISLVYLVDVPKFSKMNHRKGNPAFCPKF